VLIVVILGVRALGSSTDAADGRPSEPAATPSPTSPAIEARYGVRITQLDVLAAGGLLELRYVVLDPGRAAALHDPDGRHLPIVTSTSGRVVRETPFHSHTTAQTAGASYSILYRNDGGAVARGDRVDISIGGLHLADVLVR
jgi:hypothetical protein